MTNQRFFQLNSIHTLQLKDGAGLDALLLEKEMKKYNGGIDLSKINSIDIKDTAVYRQFVPYYYDVYASPIKEEILSLTEKYPDVVGPCSMSINSLEELYTHISIAYQISHFHYILGKRNNMRGSFPNLCCRPSSRNIQFSLMEFGYSNVACTYSKNYHGYTILPFILEKENIQGTIVVDPTSDQLWSLSNKQYDVKRNAVFIKLGDEWSYSCDWKDGKDLFPDYICSIDILRKNPNDVSDENNYYVGGKEYLQKAFSNPINITPTYTLDHPPLPIIKKSYLDWFKENFRMNI